MTLTQSEKIDRDIFGGIEDLYLLEVFRQGLLPSWKTEWPDITLDTTERD